MRASQVWIGAAALAGCALAGCSELLGFDAYLGSGATSSGAGSGASAGSGGAAGAGASSGGSSGGAGGASSGGGGATSGSGGSGAGPGSTVWASAFGAPGNEHALALDIAASGNLAIGGSFAEPAGVKLVLPPLVLDCAGGLDGLLFVLDQTAACTGAGTFFASAEPSDQQVTALAFTGDGSAIVAGTFTGSLKVPGPNITSAGGTDAFVLKVGGAGVTGAVDIGGSKDDTAVGVAVSPIGDVLITGLYQGSITAGPFAASSHGGSSDDVFVAQLNGNDGKPVWLRSFGSPNQEIVTGIAATPDGGATVVGYFTASMDFDGEQDPLVDFSGTNDAFVVRYAQNSTIAWKRSIAGDGGQRALAVAEGPAGPVLAGDFDVSVDLGKVGVISASGGKRALLLAGLDAKNGDIVSGTAVQTVEPQARLGIAARSDGGVAVAGGFQGKPDFGGGVVSPDGVDAFVLRFDAQWKSLWHRVFTGANAQEAHAVRFAKGGAVIVAGDFDGPADFGQGQLTPQGGWDMFVAELSP
jgi:hypothetical protein